jgi:hypothetical protein
MKPKYYRENIKEEGKDFIIYTTSNQEVKQFLDKGKTTPKGDYPKFKNDCDCAYPERCDCNSGFFYVRCEFMQFVSLGIWKCIFKKGDK